MTRRNPKTPPTPAAQQQHRHPPGGQTSRLGDLPDGQTGRQATPGRSASSARKHDVPPLYPIRIHDSHTAKLAHSGRQDPRHAVVPTLPQRVGEGTHRQSSPTGGPSPAALGVEGVTDWVSSRCHRPCAAIGRTCWRRDDSGMMSRPPCNRASQGKACASIAAGTLHILRPAAATPGKASRPPPRARPSSAWDRARVACQVGAAVRSGVSVAAGMAGMLACACTYRKPPREGGWEEKGGSPVAACCCGKGEEAPGPSWGPGG